MAPESQLTPDATCTKALLNWALLWHVELCGGHRPHRGPKRRTPLVDTAGGPGEGQSMAAGPWWSRAQTSPLPVTSEERASTSVFCHSPVRGSGCLRAG